MTARRVVVTGYGIVSPVGIGAEASWDALVAGRSGIDRITRFDTEPFDVDIAGEVKGFDATQYMDAKDVRRHDRCTHFAVAATGEALRHAGLLGENGRLAADVNADRFGNLDADLEDRVQRRHRLLKHHGDVVAADVAHVPLGNRGEVAALEADLATGDAAGRGDEAHDRHGRHALAASRFTHQRDRFPAPHVERNVVDGVHETVLARKRRPEVLHFEKCLGWIDVGVRYGRFTESDRLRRRRHGSHERGS